MRSRKELYDILTEDLRFDNYKATEILDHAFKAYDEDTQRREDKINALKEKYLGKLICIENTYTLPTYLFVNDIEESSLMAKIRFIGPYIEDVESSYSIFGVDEIYGSCNVDESRIEDSITIVADDEVTVKNFLVRKLGEIVDLSITKFMKNCV